MGNKWRGAAREEVSRSSKGICQIRKVAKPMDSKLHSYIVARAVEFLPEAARGFWSKELVALKAASQYPDIFAAPKFVTEEQSESEPDWYELIHSEVEGEAHLLHTALDPARIRETYPPLIFP
jgi:hypothetical protein